GRRRGASRGRPAAVLRRLLHQPVPDPPARSRRLRQRPHIVAAGSRRTVGGLGVTSLPDLAGRVALVTGASRGIGYFAARHLAAAGAHVVAVARTVGGLEELDDEIRAGGGQATLVPLDLT